MKKEDQIVSEVLGEEAVITPSDLYNTEFKNALMGGYDKVEVDTFLERVADAFEALINRVKELQEDLDGERGSNAELRDMEHALRDSLANAQKFNEDTLDSARRQADAIIADAETVKAKAGLEAEALPEALRAEIDELRAERNRLRMDLRAMLAAHTALLHDIPGAEEAVKKPTIPQDMTEDEDDA